MKALIGHLRNIFSVPELKERILYTLLLLAVFRLGSYVILPGINSQTLENMFASKQGGGLLDLLNTFVGGAFSRGSIFALGIMPYISASIIVQLLTTAVPSFTKLQKEGESGTRKLNQITRYFTIAITAAQAAGYVINLRSQYEAAIVGDQIYFWINTIFILTAGTMFLLWLGERITDKGIGNGVSLIIAIGIIADLPTALLDEFRTRPLMIFYIELLALAVVTMAVLLLVTGVRKVPVNYARRMVGNKMMAGNMNNARQYIPLKLNTAGVMPIIFGQAIMFLPPMFANFFPESQFFASVSATFNSFQSVTYNVVFVVLIIAFSYFYTAIAVNPNDIAEQLKRSGGFVPGYKPGKETADHIDEVLTRITLPGAMFLAFIAIMPGIVASFGVSQKFANFFGGTSLLIMIGVVKDTVEQINSILQMRHYDGLMKSGKLGKNPASPISIGV